MFVLGICIHLTFLFSIFDIYFKSPVVKNVNPYQPIHEPVADRLVLFVVDGLRAESFVNYTTMTHLRSIANTEGRWGISHTRVPTESRPGHVAVIAGFYEDPSAVAKGWKENPIDFDSVFNQTTNTWCWGTYDIVDIFAKGTLDSHIYIEKFDPYEQTFSTDKNTTLLDSWVFENVKDMFVRAKHDTELNEKLHGNRIALFMHLLGTDTSGHTHKPKTQNFITTLKFVDEGIKEIEQIIQDFYNKDGKTTFLMTSDHGMTDWGSHGAGDEHETQTPYVLWGAGVQQSQNQHKDDTTLDLSLDHRKDVNQADLTPLMSTILSIPVPVNSIGVLPTELLNMTLGNKAKAFYSNSRQLAAQYDKKRLDIEAYALSVLYYPYLPLTKEKLDHIINLTENLLVEKEYEKVILFSEEIIQLSLTGLDYYHNYYQRPLLILVTLSFIGWIMILLKFIVEQKIMNYQTATLNERNSFYTLSVNLAFSVPSVISCYLVFVQNLPTQYYLYFLMPLFLWWYSLSNYTVWSYMCRQVYRSTKRAIWLWIEIFCFTIGSMALGMSFTYRWILSIPLVGMGLWPFVSTGRNRLNLLILISWLSSCILLSIFSFMPVIGKKVFIELVLISGLIWLLLLSLYTWKVLHPLYQNKREQSSQIALTLVQMTMLVLSLHNVSTQSRRFELGTPVSYFYQTMAWTIAFTSLVLPLASSKRVICRLVAINTSLFNFYLLMSVSHEGLFKVTLICNVIIWLYIEFKLAHLSSANITEHLFNDDSSRETKGFTKIERSVTRQDFRRAFFFITYIILAFFGTGNIASLNSFEVRWVTCFMTSFQPFIITGLILLKTIAPFLSVACSFRAVQHLTKAPTGYLHLIVLMYSNIMGIQLLYYVKNTGSWLEIGTSISQFVIVQVITLFVVIINQIAKIMTDVCIYSFADVFKSRKKYV